MYLFILWVIEFHSVIFLLSHYLMSLSGISSKTYGSFVAFKMKRWKRETNGKTELILWQSQIWSGQKHGKSPERQCLRMKIKSMRLYFCEYDDFITEHWLPTKYMKASTHVSCVTFIHMFFISCTVVSCQNFTWQLNTTKPAFHSLLRYGVPNIKVLKLKFRHLCLIYFPCALCFIFYIF